MVYYKQGRLDEAIEDAQSMMNEGYRNSSVYGMLGYFKLLRNDDLDETTKLCEEAYDYNSDDRDIKDNLSICYFRKGEYEKAEKYLMNLSWRHLTLSRAFITAYRLQ